MWKPRRTLLVATFAVLLAACGGAADPPPRPEPRPEPVDASGRITVVPVEARDEDVEQVVGALGRIVPGARVVRADAIDAAGATDLDGTRHLDGRSVIDDLERRFGTGTESAMVVAVTSEDLYDVAVDTNFAYLVRERPYAVLSAARLGERGSGLRERRVATLVARLVGSVYLQPTEYVTMRPDTLTGLLGPLESLEDLDAMDADLCALAGESVFSMPEGEPGDLHRTLGCPVPPIPATLSGQSTLVHGAVESCRREEPDPAACVDLATLIERDAEVGRAVDRATGIPGATCRRTCVFGLQRDSEGALVVRAWERPADTLVAPPTAMALWTFRPDRPDELFPESCMPIDPAVCSTPEVVCPDPALLAWLHDRSRPLPPSLRRPADC